MPRTNQLLALGLSLAISTPAVHSLVPRTQPTATQKDWDALNKTVDGRLAIGVPWSQACFTTFNDKAIHPNTVQCEFVEQNTMNSHMNRSHVFGTYMGTQWETCMATGDACELNWQNPTDSAAFSPPAKCMQGSVPNYYIDVAKPDDASAAFKFTKKTGVSLVIKNTGHDLPGRSSAPNSFALWTHNLKKLTHNVNFVADKCSSKTAIPDAITFAAGNQWGEIYQFANDNGLMVAGGSDESVGAAGGWVQGGGHSPLSGTLGMGVDQVLQFRIVTPDGVYRTVNACQNPDLWFALRGGGGGTFGVVFEVTFRAARRIPIRVANINWDPTDANYAAVMKVFVDNATSIVNGGWGGYFTPSIGNIILLSIKQTQAEGQKTMQSLIDVTAKMGRISNVTELESYNTWFQMYVQGTAGLQDSIGLPTAITSRLIPQRNHVTAAGRAELTNAMLESSKLSSFTQIHITTPYILKNANKGSSATPAWTDSLYQIIYINTWAYNATLAERQEAYSKAGAAADMVRKITPGSGAYQNEADIHEPDHENSFWGSSNYAQLLKIKQKYDPNHLLDCWNCVGSQPKSPRFSCYI